MPKFTKDNLIKAVGGEEKLKDICIDKGSNFLNGKITSAFTAVNANSVKYVVHKKTSQSDEDTIEGKYLDKDEASAALLKIQQGVDLANIGIELTNQQRKERGQDPDDLIKNESYIKEESVGNLMGNVGSIAGNVQGTISSIGMAPEIIQGIVLECTQLIFDEVQKKITEVVQLPTRLAMETPKLIKEYTQKTFDKNKKSLADALKELSLSSEEITALQEKLEESNDLKNKTNKVMKVVSSIKSNVDNISNEISSKINMIAKYASEGPDWLSTQINNTLEENMEKINGYVDTQKKAIESEHKKFCEGVGQKIGMDLAKQYNLVIDAAAKKQFDTIQKIKTKAKTKAFSALQKAKLKIMSLTGINIPV